MQPGSEVIMAKIGKSRAQWRVLVRMYRESGEAAADFARRHGVTVGTLRWWCSEFRREGGAEEVEFVDVEVADAKRAEPLAVVLAGVGHKVIVPAGFDVGELRRLVDALC
jgi:hypothetical protein